MEKKTAKPAEAGKLAPAPAQKLSIRVLDKIETTVICPWTGD